MGYFAERRAEKKAKKAARKEARKKASLGNYVKTKLFGETMTDEEFDNFCKTTEAERAVKEKADTTGYFVYTMDYGYSSGAKIKNSDICQYFETSYEIREWVRQSLLGNKAFGGYSFNPHKILRFLPITAEFVDGSKIRRILRITDVQGRELFNAVKRTSTEQMYELLRSLP